MGREFARLAALAGVDPKALGQYAPVIDVPSRLVLVNGQKLLLNDWSTTSRRWCPACLASDRRAAGAEGSPLEAACWHRAFWDVGSIGACPVHRVALASRCQGCGRKQGWSGPAIDRCSCGADLSEVAVVPLGATQGVMGSYAAGRLGFGENTTEPTLDGMELKDALAVAERLGSFVIGGGAEVADKGYARDAGFAAIADWPVSILQSLDRSLAASRAAPGPSGLIASYCGIHAWARRCSAGPFGERLRLVIRDHAVRNGVIAPDEPVLGTTRPGTITLTRAAELLGQGFVGARKVLQSEGLVHAATRRGVAAPIQMADVQALATLRSGRLNTDEIGRRLGTAFNAQLALGRTSHKGLAPYHHDHIDDYGGMCRL